MFLSAPAGAAIDKSEHKKLILCLVALQKITAGVIMVFTDNQIAHICKGATDGITEAYVGPTLMALTLGVVGKTRFHKKALGYNAMVKNVGTVTSTLIFGLVTAWLSTERIKYAYFQFIAVGTILLLLVALMPSETDRVVDHNTARGTSFLIRSSSRLVNLFTWEDGDDDDDDDESGALVKRDEDNKDNLEEDKSHPVKVNLDTASSASSKKYTKVLTLREMYSDPGRGRSLFFLSFVLLTYTLVHAAAFPLIGQVVGLEADTRYQMTVFMIMMICAKVAEFFSQWFIVGRMDTWGYRNCMVASCIMLGAHCGLLAIVTTFTKNVWILIIAHMTRAPTTALLGLTIQLYVHLLSRRTGHFNLNYGIIDTFKTLGGALSILVTGALVTLFSYQFTFLAMTIFTVIPTLLNFGVNDVTLSNPVADSLNPDQKSKSGKPDTDV